MVMISKERIEGTLKALSAVHGEVVSYDIVIGNGMVNLRCQFVDHIVNNSFSLGLYCKNFERSNCQAVRNDGFDRACDCYMFEKR